MRRKPFIRAVSIAITAILAVSVLFGCSGQSMKEQERTSFLFDTIISIKLRCDNDAESVLDDYAMHIGNIQKDEWVYVAAVEGVTDSGVYSADIVTEQISPISFITN